MTDALAFVRISTGSQDETTQITTLENHAADHGLRIVDTWRLHGYSASAGEQEPDLRRAIEGIRQGRWHLILVTDSSRLDRREDLDAQAEVLLSIRMAGGDVISTSEPQFGKTDFAGRIVTLVAQHGNAEKSRTVKTSTWRGVQAIIANKASYGPLPAFWATTGDRFHRVAVCIDPDAVRAVYEAVRDGKSLSSIARRHNTYPASIRKLVRTRANYTGIFECRYTYEGETYTWEHTAAGDPPVDADLWHAANRVMADRGAQMNNLGGRPVTLALSWISGLLDCPGCHGHLRPLRGKTLRCGGGGKDRRSCGVAGISLNSVIAQIEAIVARDGIRVYRYERIPGNQAELDELNAELARVKQALGTTDDDDEVDRLVARRRALKARIDAFVLERDRYDMTPTDVTLGMLWRGGDEQAKRKILKAIQRHISFNVGWSKRHPQVNGRVWIEGAVPGNTLIELSAGTCIEMPVPQAA